MHSEAMELPDGRVLSWAEFGDDSSANVLVHDHGTGSSRLELAIYDGVFADLGLRVIAPERPGYGCSTGGERPRVVGDWPGDVACLIRRLDVHRFAVSEYSGGGPHALAVAASPVLGSCVSRVLLRASLAPDLPDFAPADIEAFSSPAYADAGMSTLAEGTRREHLGAVGDHWAFAGPWGFDLTTVEQRVDVWHGDADRNVPVAHAHVLGNLLPNAWVRILANDGHIAIGLSVPEQATLLVDDAEAFEAPVTDVPSRNQCPLHQARQRTS